jgi:hypothetical protein
VRRPARVAAADFDDYANVTLVDTTREAGTAVTPADPALPAWLKFKSIHPERSDVAAFRTACSGLPGDGSRSGSRPRRREEPARQRPRAVHGRQIRVDRDLCPEPNDTLPDGVLKVVACDAEEARIVALKAAIPEVSWDRMLFSAKESVYKAWFPLARRRLNFKDTRVDFDPVNPTFSARLLVDGPVVNGEMLTGLDGRWLVGNGLLATAIVILRRGEGAG